MRPLEIWKWVVIPLLLILLMQFRPEGIMGNRELPQVWAGLRPALAKLPFFAKKEAACGAS